MLDSVLYTLLASAVVAEAATLLFKAAKYIFLGVKYKIRGLKKAGATVFSVSIGLYLAAAGLMFQVIERVPWLFLGGLLLLAFSLYVFLRGGFALGVVLGHVSIPLLLHGGLLGAGFIAAVAAVLLAELLYALVYAGGDVGET